MIVMEVPKVTEGDGTDATMEAAFMAALEEVEAAKAKEKEYWAAESLRLACTTGRRTTKGEAPLMMKPVQPRRTKTEQARYDAQVAKDELHMHRRTIFKMRKKKEIAQKVKDARAKRLSHHWKYLEDTLKKEKEAKLVPLEEQEKKRIAAQEAGDAYIAKIARLTKEQDLRVKLEKKRITAKKREDAEMAKAVTLRKALASIERREKKKASFPSGTSSEA